MNMGKTFFKRIIGFLPFYRKSKQSRVDSAMLAELESLLSVLVRVALERGIVIPMGVLDMEPCSSNVDFLNNLLFQLESSPDTEIWKYVQLCEALSRELIYNSTKAIRSLQIMGNVVGDHLHGVGNQYTSLEGGERDAYFIVSFLGKLMFQRNIGEDVVDDPVFEGAMDALINNFPNETKLIEFIESYRNGRVQDFTVVECCDRLLHGFSIGKSIDFAMPINSFDLSFPLKESIADNKNYIVATSSPSQFFQNGKDISSDLARVSHLFFGRKTS
ncbi:hypothetical protein [Bacteroides sp. 51]|uniref:hypothetical protein n=1 Tax=Bacteroides sp. 51 TaxID=2302938 RepID=UPI0013D6C128|nr:hypothetical protein [Bacteroides sp. 51]NDV83423.1 hypothetical protein [Bacteroides sp. 51]